MEILTQQSYDESLYVVRGSDQNRLAWHVVLATMKILHESQSQPTVYVMEVDQLGRNIFYRDIHGKVRQASGFGPEPPESLMSWLNDNYGQFGFRGIRRQMIFSA